MLEYEKAFTDNSKIFYSPYVMYTNPRNYRSEVVNTDVYGARSSGTEDTAIADSHVLVGSSTVFGIGASTDSQTISSLLAKLTGIPTINLGGRSYNSLQELISFHQYQQRSKKFPKSIISLTGFNDLALSGMSVCSKTKTPAFFMQNMFDEQLTLTKKTFGFGEEAKFELEGASEQMQHSLGKRIEYAANAMKTYIDFMSFYCSGMGSDYIFALQPLFNWIEKPASEQEGAIFKKLEEAGSFEETYGEITSQESYRSYEQAIKEHCQARNVKFLSVTEALKDMNLGKDTSLFVDRIHFNDYGSQLVAEIIYDKMNSRH